ncbi:MAG: bifunctional riboflavin kinase/FAD synthetase [Burkholderiaceae bacterium]
MEVFRTLPAPAERRPCGLTIGNFDGVHLGHRAMLRRLGELCAPQALPVCVLSFEPHPREFFAMRSGGKPPARISNEPDKLDALAACGVDRVCILPFDDALASTSAERFIDEILVDGLQVRQLLIGDDFRFGARRQGDFELLASRQASGYQLHRMHTVSLDDGQRISSSLVRAALHAGDFERVAQLLGRPFTISGPVVKGRQLGRTLGYPTLNVRLPFARSAVHGIFVVQVHGLAARPLAGVANLGSRPAVTADGELLLEVHLFDFDRMIYGESIRVEFLSKLRDELPFESLEGLRRQIDIDAGQARDYFLANQDNHAQG